MGRNDTFARAASAFSDEGPLCPRSSNTFGEPQLVSGHDTEWQQPQLQRVPPPTHKTCKGRKKHKLLYNTEKLPEER